MNKGRHVAEGVSVKIMIRGRCTPLPGSPSSLSTSGEDGRHLQAAFPNAGGSAGSGAAAGGGAGGGAAGSSGAAGRSDGAALVNTDPALEPVEDRASSVAPMVASVREGELTIENSDTAIEVCGILRFVVY